MSDRRSVIGSLTRCRLEIREHVQNLRTHIERNRLLTETTRQTLVGSYELLREVDRRMYVEQDPNK